MMLPEEVGSGPCGEDAYSEQILQALLRLQGEGGYASGDDSARVRELLALAHVLGLGSAAIEAMASNIFPDSAEELLAEHERALRAPNDAARTIAERAARLLDHRAIIAQASSENVLDALARAGHPVVDLVNVPRVDVESDVSSEDAAIFQSSLVIADAGWTPKLRSAAMSVLRRILPAWSLGHLHHHDPAEMLVTDTEPAWSQPVPCGRTALAGAGNAPAGVFDRTRARLKSYAPASRLSARDLNAIQENLFCAPLAGTDNDALCASLGGARVYFVAVSIATGIVNQAIATGLDFRNRYVRAVYLTSTTDLRPGAAGDGGVTAGRGELFWATLTGVASSTINGVAGLTFTSSATQLGITNTSGSTRYVLACLVVGPQHTTGTRDSRVTTFDDDGGTLAGLNAALWTALRDAALPRPASGAAVWPGYSSPAYGAVHRIAVLAKTTRPASGATPYVIDTSIDWRDRILCILPAVGTSASADPSFPGVTGDASYSLTGNGFIHYTGTGIATGSDTLSGYELGLGVHVRIGVRDLDGALVVQHFASSAAAHAMVMAAIVATDQLGMRSAATALATPTTPVDGGATGAFELNWLQDAGLYAQAQPRAGTRVDAMPLGPVTRGHTHTPVAWEMARRRGVREDAVSGATDEIRQPVAGRLRRYFACDIGAGATLTLDAAQDWRDRFVHASIYVSTLDVRPGGASEALINTSGAALQKGFYLGSGGTSYAFGLGLPGLELRANATTGALEMVNGATPAYMAGMLEASFQLGPRSS